MVFIFFIDVIIVVRQQWESKVRTVLDYVQKKVPWKTLGFSYRFHIIPNIEDEGTAATLLKVAKEEMVGCVTSKQSHSLQN